MNTSVQNPYGAPRAPEAPAFAPTRKLAALAFALDLVFIAGVLCRVARVVTIFNLHQLYYDENLWWILDALDYGGALLWLGVPGFLWFVFLAYQNGRRMGQALPGTEYAALIWLLVPGANLVKSLSTLRDLWSHSSKGPAPARVTLWWLSVLGFFVALVARSWAVLPCGAIAMGLTSWVAHGLERQQRDYAARNRLDPSEQASISRRQR
ncbi:MAG: hypothetical protein KC492_05845 [Myxococcales bacterium]|nr:hypothetical protein [Myxococcales bacterium]